MERNFSYRIVRKDDKIPSEEDYDTEGEYNRAFDNYWNSFKRMEDGRNLWGGPRSYNKRYTRNEILESCQKYVADRNNRDSRLFAFTLKAFGRIISEMDDYNLVIIHY